MAYSNVCLIVFSFPTSLQISFIHAKAMGVGAGGFGILNTVVACVYKLSA